MPHELWGYLLIAPAITATWLQGRRNRMGWVLAILAQVLWIIVAVVSNQPGVIVLSIAYIGIYAYNLNKWTVEIKTKRDKKALKQAKKRSHGKVRVPVQG